MACKNVAGLKRGAGNLVEKRMPVRKRSSKGTYIETALLADNITSCRLSGQAMLVSLGIDTLAVNTAQEVLQLLAAGAFFNFIFVDLGLTGPETVRSIRGMGIDSKIVGLCLNYNDESREMFMEAGADACVEKPMTTEALGALLRQLRNL